MQAKEKTVDATALLVANGSHEGSYLQQIAEGYDLIVSIDGAADVLRAADIVPDYMIGDFDSISNESIQYFEQRNVPKIRLQPEKDYSDTHSALDKVIALGYEQIDLVGGVGSRWDHSIANLNLLYYAFEKKIRLRLIHPNNQVELIGQGEYLYPQRRDWYWSFFALFEDVQISIEQMKYPLTEKYVKRGDSIGLSNEYIGDAKIVIKKGSALVVQSRKD